MDREDLINLILDNDILIQSYVGEDNSYTIEELNKLPICELKEWMKLREIVLKFLVETEDDSFDGLRN